MQLLPRYDTGRSKAAATRALQAGAVKFTLVSARGETCKFMDGTVSNARNDVQSLWFTRYCKVFATHKARLEQMVDSERCENYMSNMLRCAIPVPSQMICSRVFFSQRGSLDQREVMSRFPPNAGAVPNRRDKTKWGFHCRPTVLTLGMVSTQRTEGLFGVAKRSGVDKKLSLCGLWERLQHVDKMLTVETAR